MNESSKNNSETKDEFDIDIENYDKQMYNLFNIFKMAHEIGLLSQNQLIERGAINDNQRLFLNREERRRYFAMIESESGQVAWDMAKYRHIVKDY